MLVGVLVELHVTCRGCRTEVPTNGVAEALACHACGKTMELPREFWKQRFDKDDFEPLLLAPGKQERSPLGSAAEIESFLRYALEMPLCTGCRKPLPADALKTAVTSGELACACGKANRVRAADGLVRTIDKHASLVVCETSRPPVRVAKPVVFACMKCGGTLEVDGTARTIECTYCAASNWLPDAVWQVIYPLPQLEPFYLVCEYSEDELRQARWEDWEVRVQDAARPDLTPVLYGQLSHDDEEDVRAAVAANPAVDAEVVARLVGDDDDEVRAAAVGNPKLPIDVLEKLAEREEMSRVVAAIVARPELPASVVEGLARSKHEASRIHAIEHPNLPVATLRKLAGDPEDKVKRAAKKRIAELEAKGIEVPGGGFFRKLFGG